MLQEEIVRDIAGRCGHLLWLDDVLGIENAGRWRWNVSLPEKIATQRLDVPAKVVIGGIVANDTIEVLLHSDRTVLVKQVRPKVVPVSSLALAGRTRRANLPAGRS